MFVKLLEKLAGSRLREGISVTPDSASGTDWNIMHQDRLSNQPSRVIGRIGLDDYGQVHKSFIAPEFQGTGAARKAYGEVARRMPGGTMYSDNLQTPGSFSTWKGMFKQHIGDSIAGKKNSFAVLPTSAGYPLYDSFYSAPHGMPNWQGQMPQKAIIPTPETARFNTQHNRLAIEAHGNTSPADMERYMAQSSTPVPGRRSLSHWEEAVPELNARYQASRRAAAPGGYPSTQDMSVTPDPIPAPPRSRKTTFSDWSKKVDSTTPQPGPGNWPHRPTLVGGTSANQITQLPTSNPFYAAVRSVTDRTAPLAVDSGDVAGAQLRAQAGGVPPVHVNSPVPLAATATRQAPRGMLSRALTRMGGAAKRGLSVMKYL